MVIEICFSRKIDGSTIVPLTLDTSAKCAALTHGNDNSATRVVKPAAICSSLLVNMMDSHLSRMKQVPGESSA